MINLTSQRTAKDAKSRQGMDMHPSKKRLGMPGAPNKNGQADLTKPAIMTD